MLIAEAHPGATQYDRRIVSLGERSKVRARLCGWDRDLGLCSEQSRCWRFESQPGVTSQRSLPLSLCRSVAPPSRLLLLFLCFSFIFSCLLLFFLILIFSLSDFWLLLVEVFHWSMSCLLQLRKRQNFNAILFRKIRQKSDFWCVLWKRLKDSGWCSPFLARDWKLVETKLVATSPETSSTTTSDSYGEHSHKSPILEFAVFC